MNPTEHRTIGALFLMLLALTTTRVSSNNAVKTGIAPAANGKCSLLILLGANPLGSEGISVDILKIKSANSEIRF